MKGGTKLDKNYVVYYEIPPMRAILHRTVVAKNEEEAVTRLKEQLQKEKVKVRKVIED